MIPVKVKVYEWIKQTVGKLTKKGYNSGEEYRFLRKAEKLYADALKSSVGGYSLSEYKQNIENELKKIKEKSGGIVNGKQSEARYSISGEGIRNSNKQKGLYSGDDTGRSTKAGTYSEDYFEIETVRGVKKFIDQVYENKSFKDRDVKNFYVKEINNDILPKYLSDIKAENKKLGIETYFVVDTIYKRSIFKLYQYCCTFKRTHQCPFFCTCVFI